VIGYILASPISLFLFAMTLLSIASAAYLEYSRIQKRRTEAAE
jgi:hypothetical protein